MEVAATGAWSSWSPHIHNQEAERKECLVLTHFPAPSPFICSLESQALPSSGDAHSERPPSTSLIRVILWGRVLMLILLVILDVIKLTAEIDSHTTRSLIGIYLNPYCSQQMKEWLTNLEEQFQLINKLFTPKQMEHNFPVLNMGSVRWLPTS